MRAVVVVETDPVADDARCVLNAREGMSMNAPFFERPDHPLDHPILLGAVRHDELLFQAIAAGDGREVATGEHQPMVILTTAPEWEAWFGGIAAEELQRTLQAGTLTTIEEPV